MSHLAHADRTARAAVPAAAAPRHEAAPRGESRLAQLIDDSPRQRGQRQALAGLLAPAGPGVLQRVERKELLKGGNEEAFRKLLTEARVQDGDVGDAFEVMAAAHLPEAGAQKFVQAQVAYQDLLVNRLRIPKAMINAFHRSAGFEYEFSEFYRQGHPEQLGAEAEVLPSHVQLAHSAPCGAVLGKRFQLETDSHNALEMVTPPFFVLVSQEGNGLLKRINDLYGEDQAGVKKLRLKLAQPKASTQQPSGKSGEEKSEEEPPRQEQPADSLIQDHLDEFEPLGFWGPWAWVYGGQEKLSASGQGGKHAGVLAQVNISLDPDEIMALAAEMITISTGLQGVGSGQSGSTPPMPGTPTALFAGIFEALGGTKEGELRGPLAFFARSVSNILGIPSILYRSTLGARPEEGNFATTIKETLGLWVKDFPHLVIQDYFTGKPEASQRFVHLVKQGASATRGMVLNDVKGNLDTLGKYRLKELESRYGKLAVLSRLKEDKIREVAELERQIPVPPQSEGEAHAAAIKQRQEAMAEINSRFIIRLKEEPLAAQQKLQVGMGTLGATLAQFEASAMSEFDAMIERLLGVLAPSPELTSSSSSTDRPAVPPRSQPEVFGEGLGVRKETFLPPAEGTRLRVAEVRSARDLSQVEPVINRT